MLTVSFSQKFFRAGKEFAVLLPSSFCRALTRGRARPLDVCQGGLFYLRLCQKLNCKLGFGGECRVKSAECRIMDNFRLARKFPFNLIFLFIKKHLKVIFYHSLIKNFNGENRQRRFSTITLHSALCILH